MQREMKLTHTIHKKQEAHVLNSALRRKFIACLREDLNAQMQGLYVIEVYTLNHILF